ncbi:M23 family metallopeptidase [Myxococcota bacterium]|nr:M23 family metallopeptidase [Myxococcota bacterium]
MESLNQQSGKLLETLDSLSEYFRDAEKLLSHTPALRPTPSIWVTSRFGIRNDPIHRSLMLMHKGLDLGGPSGMPIYAPAKGRVIFIGNRGGYGRVVILDHGYGIQTHYAHLSAYRVSVGGTVKRGQLIALMGNTGKSTGPHLHYEVRRNGLPLDPELFILD